MTKGNLRFPISTYIRAGEIYNRVSVDESISTKGMLTEVHRLYTQEQIRSNGSLPVLSFFQVRAVIANLYSIDNKIRRGPRPKSGMYKNYPEIRALFPMKKRISQRRRAYSKRAPGAFKTPTTPAVHEQHRKPKSVGTQLLMTTENGVVTLNIQTDPEMANRIIATVSKG